MPIPSFSVYQDTWQGNQLQYSTPRTNYCLYSQALTLPNWLMGVGTATITGGQTDPSGGTTASSIACTVTGAFVSATNFVTTAPATDVSDSIWMKGAVGGESILFGDNYNLGQLTPHTLTNGWIRYINTGTTPSGNHGIQINVTGGQTIYVAFCQVEIGSTATSYIPTAGSAVTVTDYSLAGNNVTLSTAPAITAVLTWTGSYYYLVRFNDDVLEFNQFSNLMYELMDCKLVSVQ